MESIGDDGGWEVVEWEVREESVEKFEPDEWFAVCTNIELQLDLTWAHRHDECDVDLCRSQNTRGGDCAVRGRDETAAVDSDGEK